MRGRDDKRGQPEPKPSIHSHRFPDQWPDQLLFHPTLWHAANVDHPVVTRDIGTTDRTAFPEERVIEVEGANVGFLRLLERKGVKDVLENER